VFDERGLAVLGRTRGSRRLRERGAGGKDGKAGECNISTSEFHQAISLILAIIVL
jgi:hypothetical protein